MLKHMVSATAILMMGTVAAQAETLRWARAGDALTLDPHAQNEGPTSALAHQMMEPLIMRDMTGAIVPALATEWAPSEEDPNVWVFELRENVTFHDGAAFDSEDVVFSLNRAMSADSDFKELLGSVKEVRASGPYTVEIETNGPNPILPSNLTNLFILDEGWAKAHGVEKPQDFEGREDTSAVRNANGTGAFMLVERAPDSKTVLKRNPNHWGKDQFSQDVTELVFTPIQNAATRVAALLSGEVDFIQDVPVQGRDLHEVPDREAPSRHLGDDGSFDHAAALLDQQGVELPPQHALAGEPHSGSDQEQAQRQHPRPGRAGPRLDRPNPGKVPGRRPRL